jgi:hypothetical protein
MTTTQAALVPAVVTPDFDSFAVRQAIAGFLAEYGDATRDAYSLDLRQWLGWCTSHELNVFGVKRAHIELFARSLEQDGKARATVARRLSTIAGFYRYSVEEQLIPVSPAVHVRRPHRDYESNATGLDRNELAMFLVQAGLAGGRDHALACLLALNGLRISEALNADIEHLGMERGHRTLTITRKGGKIATIPLAPRTARAVDLCVGEREEGPVFLNRDGTRRLDRHAATTPTASLLRRIGGLAGGKLKQLLVACPEPLRNQPMGMDVGNVSAAQSAAVWASARRRQYAFTSRPWRSNNLRYRCSDWTAIPRATSLGSFTHMWVPGTTTLDTQTLLPEAFNPDPTIGTTPLEAFADHPRSPHPDSSYVKRLLCGGWWRSMLCR